MGTVVAPAAQAILDQATTHRPNRSTLSDGTIGDAAHRAASRTTTPTAAGSSTPPTSLTIQPRAWTLTAGRDGSPSGATRGSSTSSRTVASGSPPPAGQATAERTPHRSRPRLDPLRLPLGERRELMVRRLVRSDDHRTHSDPDGGRRHEGSPRAVRDGGGGRVARLREHAPACPTWPRSPTCKRGSASKGAPMR